MTMPGVPDPGSRPPGAAAPPAAAPEQPSLAERIIPGLGTADALGDGVTAARRWLSDRHNWTRVGWFGAGVLMFGAGVVMIGARPAGNAVAAVTKPVKGIL